MEKLRALTLLASLIPLLPAGTFAATTTTASCCPKLTVASYTYTFKVSNIRAGHFGYFFYFFNNKKCFFAFFIMLILLGVGFLNKTCAEIDYYLDKKNATNHFY